jgi:hypothetical protein
MSEKENKPKQVTFEYKISSAFTVYAITGVFGGVNGQGQIIMNFFNERHAIPRTQTYAVEEYGIIGKEPISEEKKTSIIRDVMFAISINPATAKAFAQWLVNQADQHEKVFKESGKDADVKAEKDVH